MGAIRRPQYYVMLALFVTLSGPRLAVGQLAAADALHAGDTLQRVPLFPRSLAATPAPAPSRFQVLAHEIDSLSTIGGRMETETAAHQQSAQAASRFFLMSQAMRGFGHHVDWVSAVTAAGISQIGLGESGPGLWGTLRGEGQIAGFAGLTGGASWLLSNLMQYTPHFGLVHTHVSTNAPKHDH